MRGKVKRRNGKRKNAGITPAYAGKRPIDCTKVTSRAGSPPPMRGKDNQIIKQQQELGITPAYAGKSLLWLEQPVAFQDHPRLCGEK